MAAPKGADNKSLFLPTQPPVEALEQDAQKEAPISIRVTEATTSRGPIDQLAHQKLTGRHLTYPGQCAHCDKVMKRHNANKFANST